MFKEFFEKLFTPSADKILKKLRPLVDKINSLELEMQSLTMEQLKGKTDSFRQRLAQGETLDDILPEAFAAVREVSKRTTGMRHFDVQLIGGYVLHSGKISEMKTGEGKTLVATLALYLNAIEGKGAHLVTVNDYLARRDAQWMSPIYLSLGLTVGVIQHDQSKQIVWDDENTFTTRLENVSRKDAYDCDITYGTNNEFGFDYLRDNMKYTADDYVQKELNFAIVDEVDSILIDEARTPLIISGPTDERTDKYYNINAIVKLLKADVHYKVDEKRRSAQLTDEGINFVEERMNVGNLYDVENVDNLHFVNNALKAHAVFKADVDYIVRNGQIVIVDEFTGRTMEGRRYSDGLHQALEAKEDVQIQNENQTYASITFQNYFRMYKKLAGMTGTALTEANEFKQIYGLEVVPIPTNMPMKRIDNPDVVYKTEEEKFAAIADEITRLHQKGQPVLVGTVSIEKSEAISKVLSKRKIPHEVLNAKNHEREAQIVAAAGQKGAVTIATNMAGRGTDIKLGEGVEALGGLYILGTERHESRRIDNQLRGRSGRQGDSGESRFYLSMKDDLLRIFGGEKMSGILGRLGMSDGEPIEHGLISRAIENAQKKVEAMHFEIRKHLLEYDDVANSQRKIVYGMRRDILKGDDIDAIIAEYIAETVKAITEDFITDDPEDMAQGEKIFEKIFAVKVDMSGFTSRNLAFAAQELTEVANNRLEERKQEFKEHFYDFVKYILISVLDARWKEHLLHMDHLRDSVGLRGYGQKDPLIEYKKEAYNLFVNLIHKIHKETVELIMKVRLQTKSAEEIAAENAKRLKALEEENAKKLQERRSAEQAAADARKQPIKRNTPKVGRNDPCPCGSGKKYKNCHGVQ
ncbi:MAG: preprotein translocase subunit SecA [Deferribacterales bacterium]|nr:preprotein translocase subunit SecA [Deferribacterales bacterium]